LLQRNPTLGTPTLSRTNSNFLTSGGGVSTVNLRNLGDSRTLVLVNGRRFVSGVPGDTAVDLNTIPVDFIERVELLTGGASATYGSDAVAGVVNIILKRKFSGVLVDASNGRSSRSDDLKNKLALTGGITSEDGASNLMVHFGYTKQGSVNSRDRSASAVDQYSTGALSGDARSCSMPPCRTIPAPPPRDVFIRRGPATSPTTAAAMSSRSQPTAAPPRRPLASTVGSYTTTGFQLTYDLRKAIQLYVGMNNAFDKRAPGFISGLQGNSTGTETDASAYDPIGRRYDIGARIQL
jgi:outer membrane receptor protein involved in Fe transport